MNKRKLLISGILLGMATGLPAYTVYADEDPEVERVLSEGESKVVAKIESDFDDLELYDTEGDSLVEALRTGGELAVVEKGVVDENGNPVMVDKLDESGNPIPVIAGEGEPANADGNLLDADGNIVYEQVQQIELVSVSAEPLGMGEISLALGLADQLLEEGGDYAALVDVLTNDGGTGILDLRQDGMGWGEIFQQYDLKVGEVMRAIKSDNGNKPDKANQANLANKPEKGTRPEKADKPEKPERPDRPEKPEKPERPEKPEKPEKPERPEKPEKPERPGKP